MPPNFGKIGVICGGLSSERDISLKSGLAIYSALTKDGFDVEEIDLETEEPREINSIISAHSIDVVFIAMHGRFGEDGRLQAILEDRDIPYVGSDSLASAFAMDKITTRRIFQEHNIPVPDSVVLNISQKEELRVDDLSFPLVVKPQAQGSSIGISLVNTAAEIGRALYIAFQYDDNVLLEKYIEGKELTVGIVGNHTLIPIEILSQNAFFDFQAKYSKGVTQYIVPASIDSNLSERIQRLSLKAHRVLGCRHLSRVDLMLNKDNDPFILEVNTIPGFTETSLVPKAARYEGITFAQLCVNLLALACSEPTSLLI